MARRQVDDQPADPAFEDRQFRGDDLEMPAERTPNLRVQLAKSTPRKAREIKPQRRTLFFPGGIGAAPTGLSLVGACRSKPYLSGGGAVFDSCAPQQNTLKSNLLWDCQLNEVRLVSLPENTELIAFPRVRGVQSHIEWKQGRMRSRLGQPHSAAVAYQHRLDEELGRIFRQCDKPGRWQKHTILVAFSKSIPLND